MVLKLPLAFARLACRAGLAVCAALAVSMPALAGAPESPKLQARAWLLVDTASGQALAEHRADEKIEPASLTKLMTAYLSFRALKEGVLREDQVLPVSEAAWKAPGSRMFVQPNRAVTVAELLKGMIIQSGNDASLVLAEGVAGSEEAFVKRMNDAARALGMKHTRFRNATGLPHPEHVSTARDLARLARALIRDFPERYRLYAQREYTYNGITQANRNRLLFTDPSVDGLKTGHTDSAGYCLIASAKRDQRRLISVVLGAGSETARASESQKLLNHGFQAFETVRLYAANTPVGAQRVYKGTLNELKLGFAQDFYVSVPRGSAQRLKVTLLTQQPRLAPVRQGETAGRLRLHLDGQVLAEYPIQALHAVPVASLLGRGWDSLMLMFQ